MTEPIKIILVDNNLQFLEGLQLFFQRDSKYHVLELLSNGEQLVSSDKLHLADLIISDIDMPVMGGVEAARKVNEKLPHLPIIALTMHVESVFIADMISAGFKGYVYKPKLTKDLIRVINEVLNESVSFPDNLKENNN